MAGETVVMEETCKIEDPSDEIVLDQKMHDDIICAVFGSMICGIAAPAC